MMQIVRWSLVLMIVASIILPSSIVYAADESTDVDVTSLPAHELSQAEVVPAKQGVDSVSAPLATEPEPVSENKMPAPQGTVSSLTTIPAEGRSNIDDLSISSQAQAEASLSSIVTRPSPIPASADVVVSALQFNSTVDAIELRNQDDNLIDLSHWKIIVTVVDTQLDELACQVDLSGYLLPKQYMTIAQQGTVTVMHGSGELYEADLSCDMHGRVSYINIEQDGGVVESLYLEDITDHSKPWARKGFTASTLTGVFTKDFSLANHEFYVSELYYPPEDNPLQILEVHSNPAVCEITMRPECLKYVKVFNASDDPVNLSQYRLRAGTPDKVSTSSNTTRLAGVVPPKETVLITRSVSDAPIYLAASDGSVWFQDMYGIKEYASGVMPYEGADKVANKGKSWAFDARDKTWKWAIPSPNTADNRFEAIKPATETPAATNLMPCREGQYRSEETNRCRTLVVSSVSRLVPCKEGQYRSEETNRCRSIATATSAIPKPCADDQFRNPETGRCKKIASSEELTLADCGEGRERNPETNRCRNIKSVAAIPEAAFAVESVKDATQAFIGWWALGGVGVLALGYGAWEWRREVAVLLGRIGTFFHSSK